MLVLLSTRAEKARPSVTKHPKVTALETDRETDTASTTTTTTKVKPEGPTKTSKSMASVCCIISYFLVYII